LLVAVAAGDLGNLTIDWHDQAAVCVVMAAAGYPGDYNKGEEIHGLDAAATIDDLIVFHAGTASKAGKVVTNGGRVLGVTARGDSVKAAIAKAYEGVKAIRWTGAQYRSDIGKKAL